MLFTTVACPCEFSTFTQTSEIGETPDLPKTREQSLIEAR